MLGFGLPAQAYLVCATNILYCSVLEYRYIYELAKAGKIDLHVYAGNPSTAPPSVFPTEWNSTTIPSLYEKWGIRKFYLTSKTRSSRPRVLITIPPIIQYAKHYAAMLSYVNPQTSKV